MDDYFEDFDDDMNSSFDDDEFNDEADENLFPEDFIEEDEILFHEEKETDADGYDGMGWQEIALLGAMSEDIAERKRQKEKLLKKNNKSN